jgi:23S rRNA (uracil1939-C5)-methyltransferase
MKRKEKRPLPVIEYVEITGIAAEGKALSRVDDKVLFIPFGAPGDVVDVRITSKRRSFMQGEIIHFHKRSEHRVEPFCAHFGLCGGCKWQHLPYPSQGDAKQQQVVDALERIGGFKGVEVSPILLSEQERFYRNKLEYTFSDRRWLTSEELPESGERPEVDYHGLGFHLPGRFDRILDIDKCHLQPEPSNLIRLFVKREAQDLAIPFYRPRTHEGVMRNLIIRNNTAGEFMVIVVVSSLNQQVMQLMERIRDHFPEIASLHYVVNDKRNDDIGDREVVCFSGTPWITDTMDELTFRIGPKSFYQTNPGQMLHLYRNALECANLTGDETVYDLYTGTGTIAIFAARYAQKVIGIEYVEQAVEDARENAGINNIHNTTFIAGDMAKVLTSDFATTHGKPDVIITDPPRAGMHPDVVAQILSLDPRKIVYVSCNPATQARDIAMMGEKYAIAKVQPVDMFPHTHHVENVVLLVRKKA